MGREVTEQGATRWVNPSDFGNTKLPGRRYDRHPDLPKRYDPGGKVPWFKRRPPLPKLPGKDLRHTLPKPGFGGMAGRAAGAGFAAGVIIGGIDVVDHLWKTRETPKPNPLKGWVRVGWCPPMPQNSGGPKIYRGGCLSSQAGTDMWPGHTRPIEPGQTTFGYWYTTSEPFQAAPLPGARYSHGESWERKSATVPYPETIPDWWWGDPIPLVPNPNPWRWIPSERHVPDVSPDALPFQEARPNASQPRQGREISPEPNDGTKKENKPVRKIDPRPRERTRRNEREKKVLSRAARIGIMFFRALDAVSEAAEVVDAMYEALPPKVRKKWDCDGFMPGRHPLIDTAGQYGIDRADCKAKALWWNFHSMDVQTAVENIIKNHLSDKVIGAMQRVLPRNTVNAFEDAELQLNKLLKDFMDELISLEASGDYKFNYEDFRQIRGK